ncbi:MAG: hypothetical protein H8D23_21880 [Candidatus Brocadiales bacterium]|nr:hypothetical protein [Candidatus Brocadiales bacterium]
MSINQEIISSHLAKWQDILRIRDWEIRIIVAEKDWRKSGDIKIDQDNKIAALMINQKLENQFLEEVIIHELLHLKLWSMDQLIEELLTGVFGSDEKDPKRVFAYGQFMGVLESTTQDLTKALLSATGEEREFLGLRVERQVRKELEHK